MRSCVKAALIGATVGAAIEFLQNNTLPGIGRGALAGGAIGASLTLFKRVNMVMLLTLTGGGLGAALIGCPLALSYFMGENGALGTAPIPLSLLGGKILAAASAGALVGFGLAKTCRLSVRIFTQLLHESEAQRAREQRAERVHIQ